MDRRNFLIGAAAAAAAAMAVEESISDPGFVAANRAAWQTLIDHGRIQGDINHWAQPDPKAQQFEYNHAFAVALAALSSELVNESTEPPTTTTVIPPVTTTTQTPTTTTTAATTTTTEPPTTTTTEPPSGFDVVVSPGDDIQAVVSQVGAGGSTWSDGPVIGFTAGTYEGVSLIPLQAQTFAPVDGPGTVSFDGKFVDEDNWVVGQAFRGPGPQSQDAAPYVTIRDLELHHYGNPWAAQRGVIHGAMAGPGGWHVINCDVHHGKGSGISLDGDDALILGGRSHHNRQTGFKFGDGNRQIGDGLQVDNNNLKPSWEADWDNWTTWTFTPWHELPSSENYFPDRNDIPYYYRPGWEGGGSKCNGTWDLTLRNMVVFANWGPGLWCDFNGGRTDYLNNSVVDHPNAAIFHEVYDGGRVIGNSIRNIGHQPGSHSVYHWKSGVHLAQGGAVEVSDNVIEDSVFGIVALSQCRGGQGPGSVTGTGNVVRNSGINGAFSDCGQVPSFNVGITVE